MTPEAPPIILFDGVCNLCNASVRFVLKRDPQELFRFASLQSDLGKSLLVKHHLPSDLSTIVLIQGEKAWVRSSAALRIARRLKGLWPVLSVFLLIPPPLRNGSTVSLPAIAIAGLDAKKPAPYRTPLTPTASFNSVTNGLTFRVSYDILPNIFYKEPIE